MDIKKVYGIAQRPGVMSGTGEPVEVSLVDAGGRTLETHEVDAGAVGDLVTKFVMAGLPPGGHIKISDVQ